MWAANSTMTIQSPKARLHNGRKTHPGRIKKLQATTLNLQARTMMEFTLKKRQAKTLKLQAYTMIEFTWRRILIRPMQRLLWPRIGLRDSNPNVIPFLRIAWSHKSPILVTYLNPKTPKNPKTFWTLIRTFGLRVWVENLLLEGRVPAVVLVVNHLLFFFQG